MGTLQERASGAGRGRHPAPHRSHVVILFDDATARDLLDGLRLLEGRLIGTPRRLSPGVLELRRIAERSRATPGDQPGHADAGAGDAGHMNAALLTTDEAARVLHVSPSTVRREVREDRLPVVRIGRAVRFRPVDLDAFTQSRRARDAVAIPPATWPASRAVAQPKET